LYLLNIPNLFDDHAGKHCFTSEQTRSFAAMQTPANGIFKNFDLEICLVSSDHISAPEFFVVINDTSNLEPVE